MARIVITGFVSLDGFIATPDGLPAFLAMPDFVPHLSYGWQEFDDQIEAVVMGRVALDAGLGSRNWPWPGKQIYVLTSRPVPPEVPAVVVVAADSPSGLLDRLRSAGLAGDAFLLGGQRTLAAFLGLGGGGPARGPAVPGHPRGGRAVLAAGHAAIAAAARAAEHLPGRHPAQRLHARVRKSRRRAITPSLSRASGSPHRGSRALPP